MFKFFKFNLNKIFQKKLMKNINYKYQFKSFKNTLKILFYFCFNIFPIYGGKMSTHCLTPCVKSYLPDLPTKSGHGTMSISHLKEKRY